MSSCVDEPAPGRARDTIIWHKLGEWSGSGNLQTETFTCDSGGLRLQWETRNETAPGKGYFKMAVHSAVSGRSMSAYQRSKYAAHTACSSTIAGCYSFRHPGVRPLRWKANVVSLCT